MQVKQRLDALTSLRFFAAAMIVLGHADPIFGSFGVAQSLPLNQGVSFFFVLSGFILAWNYPILSNWSDRRKFWLARVARIWPLHVVTCLLWIALIFNFDRSAYFPGILGLAKLVANLLLLQSWVPVHDWALSFNGVAWSISTEFAFYAMFPLLIALWQKSWHQLLLCQALIILLTISACTFYAISGSDDYPGVGLLGLLYFNPVVRIFEFSIGIGLTILVREIAAAKPTLSNWQWLVIELAALLAAAVGLLAAANFSGIGQTLGAPAAYYFAKEGLWLFWAILIGVFALSRGPLTRLLSFRVVVFFGEISFALYLCHALVIHYLENYTDQIQQYGLFGYGIFWLWCLTLSAILFVGVETPCRKFIMGVAMSKGIAAALRGCFSVREATAILLLICTASAMFFLRPSTIIGLDYAGVAAFMQASSEQVGIPDNVKFDDRYQIVALRVHAGDGGIASIQVLLRSTKNVLAQDILALHVIDKNGQMIANDDRKLDVGRKAIPAGTYWIQKFQISKAKMDLAVSLGLAMYRHPDALFDCVGGHRDWGGKRLILPFKL